VAVFGLAAVAGAAERLAEGGVRHWQLSDAASTGPAHPLAHLWGWEAVGVPASAVFARVLPRRVADPAALTFGALPPLDEAHYDDLRVALTADRPDLLLGGGDAATLLLLGRLARDLDLPAVLVAFPATASPRAVVLALLPGDGGNGRDVADLAAYLNGAPLGDPANDLNTPERRLDWQDANLHAAALARLLLLGAAAAPADLGRIVFGARRTLLVQGAAGWPWRVQYVDLARATPLTLPALAPVPLGRQSARGPILVVGCGRIGSQAARSLLAAGATPALALIEGGRVDAGDLSGAFYTADQIGKNRADALAQQLIRIALKPRTTPEWTPAAFTDDWSGLQRASGDWCFTQVPRDAKPGPWFESLLDTLRPVAVILALGPYEDGRLARVLRHKGVPHVVSRCAADGAWFEALVVDGSRGPCRECLQAGALPIVGAPTATSIETGRAANLVARLAWQLSLDPAARAPWFARLLAEEQTALMGWNGTAGGAAGAAGDAPGQVGVRGLPAGAGPCPECRYRAAERLVV
jgi:hypothetical protein